MIVPRADELFSVEETLVADECVRSAMAAAYNRLRTESVTKKA